MTVKELQEKCAFAAVTMPDGEREVHGCYIGDLLSWVMGRAQADNVWITIMSNINIVAVASLTDVSCIVLAEGVALDEKIISTAEAKGINILSCEKRAYETAVSVYESI